MSEYVSESVIITLACLINIWSRGILTLSNAKNPLSFDLNPNFGPTSPNFIPKNIPVKYIYTTRVCRVCAHSSIVCAFFCDCTIIIIIEMYKYLNKKLSFL